MTFHRSAEVKRPKSRRSEAAAETIDWLNRVHECVSGVLALESEPDGPRL